MSSANNTSTTTTTTTTSNDNTSNSNCTPSATPRPKLDLFHDSPRLVAKKCRTSTPSLRPPKPPTKSSSSTRRCRQSIGPIDLNHYNQHHHNLSLQHHHLHHPKFFTSNTRRDQLNNTNPTYFFSSYDQRSSTPTSTREPLHYKHDGSFSFGLRDNSILEQNDHENDTSSTSMICKLNKEFDIISKIGSGNFGDVYKVKSKMELDKYYAIKRTLMPFTSEADRKRKFQEVENHQSLPPHDYCVKYYNSWEEDGYLYIQTELCKTNLNQIIEMDVENRLPESRVWKYLINLLLAVKHLHDHDLLHLDIKPDNIFISFDDKAKLGDFGLMCNYSDLNSSNSTIDVHNSFRPNDPDDSDSIEEGDSKYLASEAMQGKFTKAADIFSLGITMFEAASGLDLPQRGETYHKLRQNQIDEIYFNGLSDELVKIIKLMMEADYLRRPLVDELLQMEAIRSRRSSLNI